MKNVWEKWTGISLVKRIVVGLIIGVVLASACLEMCLSGLLRESHRFWCSFW